ncbi:tyrosine-type recombinase/integrase [Nesterenkonia aerolata]|uniref:Tyrosine-type recombinase/integrase n=1 Tax=Nesterenkonia aerolata TaxID=3074079 RepID=A0ABU2DNU6_9MICC|nr:tyrosine-type recombinase/integrase [Nesterenkonia sp. LY-0111]MDR8018193.1 tyrosine-type recombinase/integrase [Nesterenkonia sp. LY-0111]
MASIRKREGKKVTSYQVVYRDQEGRSQTETFRNFNAARDFKRRVEYEVQSGTHISSSAGKVTPAEFYAEYRQRQVWEPGTYRNYDVAMRSCSFADVPFSKLRTAHAEKWVREMADSLAPGTIRTYVRCVKSVLSGAVRERHLVRSPLDGVPLPRLGTGQMHIPTPQQVGQILEGSEPHYRALWAVCAFAGLRAGEAAGLKVEDVRFLQRQLRVERQAGRDDRDGGVLVKSPKYASHRTVYVPDALLEILAAHIEMGTNGDWLFWGSGGQPPGHNVVGYQWRKMLDGLGLVRFRLHDLRHYFASGLIAAGTDVVTVQKQLGHKSASVTLNTYAHLWSTAEDVTREAVAGLMDQTMGAHAVNTVQNA